MLSHAWQYRQRPRTLSSVRVWSCYLPSVGVPIASVAVSTPEWSVFPSAIHAIVFKRLEEIPVVHRTDRNDSCATELLNQIAVLTKVSQHFPAADIVEILTD